MARQSEDAEVEIAPVRAPVSSQGAPAGCEGQHGRSHILDSKVLPNSDLKSGLYKRIILKERQELKLPLEETMKAVEAPTVRKEVPPTVGDTSIVVVGNNDGNVNFGRLIVEGKRSSHATADFAPDFQDTG